jgi:hypothetical protein
VNFAYRFRLGNHLLFLWAGQGQMSHKAVEIQPSTGPKGPFLRRVNAALKGRSSTLESNDSGICTSYGSECQHSGAEARARQSPLRADGVVSEKVEFRGRGGSASPSLDGRRRPSPHEPCSPHELCSVATLALLRHYTGRAADRERSRTRGGRSVGVRGLGSWPW